MQAAAVRRPHFAAGVAFVGASVIAAAAVTPMPEIHLPDVSLPSIHAAEVNLAALANPLEVYAQVFQTAFANTNTLIQNTVPGQLLNQILQNQVSSAATLLNGLSTAGGGIAAAASQVPAVLATAVSQLAAGNVEGAVNSLLSVPLTVAAPALNLLPVLQGILTKPLTNLVNVVNAFTADPLATLLAVSGFVAPLISVPGAAAAAIQNVINAVGTGDLGAVANAVLTAPATIADGILNGGYGPDLGPLAGIPAGSGIVVKAGGLLASSSSSFDADGNFVINTGGPLYALQQVLKMITDAIAPQAPAPTAAIASLPTAAAATITLSTDPAAPADKTADTTTPAASTPAASADKPAVTDKTPSTPASTKDGGESSSAPADSTKDTPSETATDTSTGTPAKTPSKTPAETPSKASPTTKPTGSAPDVTTGNKVEPGTTAGADAPKSNGSSTSTGEKDGTSTEGSTTAAAGGAEKGASAASGSESKGAAKGSAA